MAEFILEHPWGLASQEVYAIIGNPDDPEQVRDVVNDQWDDLADDTLDDWALLGTPDADFPRKIVFDLPTGLTSGLYYPVTFFQRVTPSTNDKANDVYLGSANWGYVQSNVRMVSDDSGAADNMETAFDGGSYNVGGGAVVAASVTGAVGSVTGNVGGNVAGSVGSVTGNVGGNVTGSVGSVTGSVGGNVTGSVGSLATQAKADVNAEVDTALADINLDHLIKVAVDTDFPTTVHLNSVIGHLADNGTSATFDRTTDALEALRDNTGTAGAGLTSIDLPDQTMNITGNITGNLSGSVGSVTGAVGSVTGNVGGNVTGSIGSLATQAKADVQDEAEQALRTYNLDHLLSAAVDTSFANTVHLDSVIGYLADAGGTATYDRTTDALEVLGAGGVAPTAAQIADAVWDEATSGHTTSGTFGEQAKTDIDALLALAGTTGVVVNSFTTAGKAEVQQEATDALNAYDPPTNAEMEARTLAAAAYFDPTSDKVQLHATQPDYAPSKAGDAMALTSSERNSVADTTLARAVENVEDTADKHSLAAVVMIGTNAAVSGTTLTAKKPSDDSTFFTYTVTVDAAADPITGVS